jgi:putative redox protein
MDDSHNTTNTMTKHEVNTVWAGKMAFDSHLGQHTVHIDTKPEMGDDSGPGPKSLLLTALTGCTGMDLVSLLPKMRVPFDSLRISAEAELTEEHPKVYKSIHLRYVISGAEVREDKVREAITMSQDKYCGVSAMLKAHCPITWELVVELRS